MIKLLIADDEYLVTDSIKYIVDKHVPEVEVIAAVGTGREAIEKSLELKPDIIFMDIHMPGIDGIEAIKKIKASGIDAVFVIITAYEYFNYAQEAVALGVHEYILKPVSKGKVIEILNNIGKMIVKKREELQREIMLKERMNKVIPHLEGQFVYSQLFDGRMLKDIDFYQELFGMELQYGYVMMAVVEEETASGREENLQRSLDRQKFYEVFRIGLKSLCNCLIGPPMLDRVVAYIPVDRDMDSYEIRNSSINIASRLCNRISRETGLRYRIGIGKINTIENFMRSCDEAYMAASIQSAGIVTHFEDIPASDRRMDAYPRGQEKVLIDKLVAGDVDGVLQAFEAIFLWLSISCKNDLDRMKSKLIELVYIIKRAVPYCIEEDSAKDQLFLTELLKLHEVGDLKSRTAGYLKQIMLAAEECRLKEINGLMSKVIKFINENYNRDISMDEVAKATNLSYHYFSKFFKESVGKSFVEYLTELRLEKSKAFLANTNDSIKEISYRIGYSDPNYYCKIFKKATGMTPTEYRDNLAAHEAGVHSDEK